jgi:hypothetical protein
MTVIATVIDSASGAAIQKIKFGRMPRIGHAFVLETGQQVVAQRVEVGKPAPGKFISPVTVWVAGAQDMRQP